MSHVSHKLSNSFEGALAGGGDPATSPLYVFGPFLRLIVVAGVAEITFGASIWLVIVTVAMVSAMYRLVMNWVTDGSGGSGLNEEEFGSWAVKINAAITFVEYTLTFLVSIAALVTFIADRFPVLNHTFLGFSFRTFVAVTLSLVTGWLVNRGPKMAARTFGPATAGVLLLLWAMIIATVWRFGLHLPSIDFRAFQPDYLHLTFGGYARILALMTGIEIFANLVAAYDGTPQQKSRKAFGSLLIVMGTTAITMVVVGPAIWQLSDPTNEGISVFTQTMDQLLPAPLAYLGTLVGIAVLLSAAAASAQGLQNLALGLRFRHYLPARLGQRNRFDVADKPVWIEVGVASLCFLVFGTHEETYLALYAAGVFILLSLTGWAAAKRLIREIRLKFSASRVVALAGTVLAALLTSGATILIFEERFFEGAWTYLLFLPVLYAAFTRVRSRLGDPTPLEDHLGRMFVGQYLLPYQREERPEDETAFDSIVIPLDGSPFSEHALPLAQILSRVYESRMTLLTVVPPGRKELRLPVSPGGSGEPPGGEVDLQAYLGQLAWELKKTGAHADFAISSGSPANEIHAVARDMEADLIVMSTHGRSEVERWFVGSVANSVIHLTSIPLLLTRPTDEWTSRRSQFKRLLVSLDGSEGSERILRYVRTLATRFESDVLLLSIPEADSEASLLQEYLDNVAAALRERGLKARSLVTGSGAARTIVAVSESEQSDLIMMATQGRGGLKRGSSIGSVADMVVQSTQCPIFLVPILKRGMGKVRIIPQIT